jgi:hypothetical protein
MLVHASIACRQHISKTQPFFLRQRSSHFSYICFLFSVFCSPQPGGRGAVLHPHLTARLKIANSSTGTIVDAPARGARLAFWFCPVFLRFAALNRRSKHVVHVRSLFSLSPSTVERLSVRLKSTSTCPFFLLWATNSRWGE